FRVVCHERCHEYRRCATVREMKEGPSGFGDQETIPSHRKLLRSRAVVVSVAETPGRRSRQARSREASASEPSMKCRKRFRRCQNRGVTREVSSGHNREDESTDAEHRGGGGRSR